MTAILNCNREEVDSGGKVYLHCLGGIGRTGTVLGGYFAENGDGTPLASLKALTAAEKGYFWPTPQTEGAARFRPALEKHYLRSAQEVIPSAFAYLPDASCYVDCGIAFASLNVLKVGAANADFFRKLLLGHF